MSLKLKPLILPQLVEERKQLEVHQTDGDNTQIYYTYNSSSSDVTSHSPATPTFSRSSHSRYSSSASSLEMSASCLESPASPVQSVQQTVQTPAVQPTKTKSPLPDVQEEPLEREEEDHTVVPDQTDASRIEITYRDDDEGEFGLYDCLCDEPCPHRNNLVQSATGRPSIACDYFDYDLGFLSDPDVSHISQQKKRRHGSDASFSSWSTKLGSRMPSLSRWKSSSKRHHLTFSPPSDSSLDQRPAFKVGSSRSSSISVPVRRASRQASEVPIPSTPALSFYESLESVVLPSPLETTMQATAGKSLERERKMATTPLLPPLLTDAAPSQMQPSSLQPSPLQSPSIAPASFMEMSAPSQTYPTPPLSAKASSTSIRRTTVSSAGGELASPLPYLLDQQDSWSDRLGHANFTIEPRPYSPEAANLVTFQQFRADWNQARVNYTRHLARTGEHYGMTSKTYAYTVAKWNEIDQEWARLEEDLVRRLDLVGNADATTHLRRATQEVMPTVIPGMLSEEGKFPERGDVDIVGPMLRNPVMERDGYQEHKRDGSHNSASAWFKSLAGKVALRR